MSKGLKTKESLLSRQKGHYSHSHRVLYKGNQAQQFREWGSNYQKFGM